MDEAPAPFRVPVGVVAVEAYRAVFGRLGLVLELAWLPLLILLAAAILPGLLLPRAAAGDTAIRVSPADAIEAVAAVFCLSAFAVRWLQALLHGRPRAVPPGRFPRIYLRFLLYTALIYLAALALMAVIVGAAGLADTFGLAPTRALFAGIVLAASLASLVLWLLCARFALLFPAAAHGAPLGFGAAWRVMRGNSWRLFGCGIVTCAPVVAAVALVLALVLAAAHIGTPGDAPLLGIRLLSGLADTLADFVIVALGSAILAGFYRRIILGQAPVPPSQ